MAKKLISFKTKGMNQDLSVSAFNPEFSFENINLRLSTVEGNTMMSWVNEKGTASITLYDGKEYWSKEGESDVYEEPQDSSSWTHYPIGKEITVLGIPLGTAVLNSQIILFTCNNVTEESDKVYPDHIYLLKWYNASANQMVCKELYKGDLKFDDNYPIETLVSYENKLIQKVYWTDGLNQPRVINIVGDIKEDLDTQFDFIPELQLKEKVVIKKQIGGGSFPAGVIQYCFTYFNKYMQESNIFYTSPLFYVSYANRAGSPEDTSIANSFKIKVTNVDENFDYVRIYSIHRTSLNGTPIAKRVADVSLKEDTSSNNTVTTNSFDADITDDTTEVLTDSEGNKYIEYIDTGVNGDSIDPTELLYKGGYGIVAGTIEQKDSTLFMGNLQQQSLSKYNEIKEEVESNVTIGYYNNYYNMIKTLKLEDYVSKSDYFNELNIETEYTDMATGSSVSTGHIGASCASFRVQNYYRLGVQFQDSLGVWTSPIYIGDNQIPVKDSTTTPIFEANYWEKTSDDRGLTNQTFFGEIPSNIVESLYNKGYRKARAVAVFPNYEDRVVLYQGVINPTMYTSEERSNKTLYSQASWFFRPLYEINKIIKVAESEDVRTFSFESSLSKEVIKNNILSDSILNDSTKPSLYSPAFESFYYSTDIEKDSEGGTSLISPFTSGNYLLNDIEVQGDYDGADRFKIDWQTVTFNSPDLEFYDIEGAHTELLDINFRQMGASVFNYTHSMINIQTETPTVNSRSAGAKFNNKLFRGTGGCGIGSGLWYEDWIIDEERDTSNFIYAQSDIQAWIVSPWQRDGSLNNDITRPSNGGVQTAKLKKKVIANLRYANTLFSPSADTVSLDINPVLFMSDQNIIEKINSDKIYRGNIDTLQTSRCDTGNYGTNPFDYTSRNWIFIDSNLPDTFKTLVEKTHDLFNATNRSYYDSYLNCDRIPRPLQKGTGNYPSDKNLYIEVQEALNNWSDAFNAYENENVTTNVFTGDDKDFLEDCVTKFSTFKVEDWSWLMYTGGQWYFGEDFDADTTVVDIDKLSRTVLKYAKEMHIYWLKVDDEGVYRSLGPKGSDSGYDWESISSDVGDTYTALRERNSLVRIKYKSTPHLVLDVKGTELNGQSVFWDLSDVEDKKYILPIINIERDTTDETFKNTIFGGTSEDALKANVWVPCGEPVNLPSTATDTYFYYLYGDTYYQRYDCLKTYPFTEEDVNQIVEIGSFMLESYVNIDGRYDRNRGQANNLNMRPTNFNLLNPVYSQRDNFFTYRIEEDDYYKNKEYPNQITWSKTKASGDETDMWTNVTMANTLEMDGDKGEVTKLIRLNDQLLCFQDTGISQILYNDNVQIASTTGVPIEIANSQKVQGKRYLSNTIGCSNKWSIVSTPLGIYFMDNTNKSIYVFNGQLNNLSSTGGFNTWCKKNILNTNGTWTPTAFNDNFVGYYDIINQDVLFIGEDEDNALAFSEKFNTFTSFYDYGNTPYFCNLEGKGVWFKAISNNTDLWQHQAGEYCSFFGSYKPYGMTLVGNPEPQTDKIFTNLEFRATIDTDGILEEENNKFTPLLPFDSLEVWNEYQHGYTSLENLTGNSAFKHGNDTSSLKRKFRIWRCDIPRNNCLLDSERDITCPYSTDAELNISRYIKNPMDRMRNPWLYLKLIKDTSDNNNYRTELHDFVMTYFN